MTKTLKYILFAGIVTSCAPFDKNWPRLSDKHDTSFKDEQFNAQTTPDIERLAPLESNTVMVGEAKSRVNMITAAISREWDAYDKALSALDTAEGSENRSIAWHGAQLALTRVSLEIGNLQDMTALILRGNEQEVAELMSSINAQFSDEAVRLATERRKLKALT